MSTTEPVGYQCRMKTTREGSQWREWHEITKEEYERHSSTPQPDPNTSDSSIIMCAIIREVRKLFTNPQHELTVWYGEMPESNGKTNYTAILRRKEAGSLLDGLSSGITIARSEYPDRVRYEADRMRFLIGELEVEPDILAYDAEKHSGYVHPDRFEQMAESKGYDVTKTECGHYLSEKTRDLREGWDAARSTW